MRRRSWGEIVRALRPKQLQETETFRRNAIASASDRVKVNDYLDAVREIERRIQGIEKHSQTELPTLERPTGSARHPLLLPIRGGP